MPVNKVAPNGCIRFYMDYTKNIERELTQCSLKSRTDAMPSLFLPYYNKNTTNIEVFMTHDEIRKASTKKLKDILKNDDPDVDLHDMIDYELYTREFS